MRSLAFVIALAASIPAAAATDDTARAEVAAAVARVMGAINASDADAFLAAQQPGMMIQVQRFDAAGGATLQSLPATDFAARMRTQKVRIDERLVAPTILVTRDFAHVWAAYSLDVDGKRVHCGVDSFGFAKTGGKWLLTSLAWTADPLGCPK